MRGCKASPCVTELLKEHTTLRLGGPASAWVRATTEQELVDAMTTVEGPVLVLGSGSNLVVADEGFAGTVVEVATSGVRADVEGDDPTCGGVMVTVAAGEDWDASSRSAVDRGWVGVEALAGIPGLVGATPIQNVGAYGQEVSQTVAQVRVWDRVLKGCAPSRTPTAASATARRGSRPTPSRHVVLDVTFQLSQGSLGTSVQYAELARTLDVELGAARPAGRRARRRPRAAPQQGHGPRPGRPRHLERRLVLHQPGRRRRRRTRRTRRPGPSPTAG